MSDVFADFDNKLIWMKIIFSDSFDIREHQIMHYFAKPRIRLSEPRHIAEKIPTYLL